MKLCYIAKIQKVFTFLQKKYSRTPLNQNKEGGSQFEYRLLLLTHEHLKISVLKYLCIGNELQTFSVGYLVL